VPEGAVISALDAVVDLLERLAGRQAQASRAARVPPASRPVRLPAALRRGDRVAVMSPCGPVLDHGLLDAGIAVLESWGLQVVEGTSARRSAGHLAGTDAQRAADLNAAFTDPDVRGIWVARGGYGLTRVVDRLDWSAVAADPKVVVGFSDVTTLLVAARQRIGLVTVHGPFAGRLAAAPTTVVERMRRVVFGEPVARTLTGQALESSSIAGASGPLVGGNLTVLAAMCGTPDQLDATGCVVLLEEVGEAPYRVDRALTQLRATGALDGAVGIVVGQAVGCAPPADRPSATVDEVFAERLGDLGVPVVTGLPIGHMADHHAVLHGATASIDAATGHVEVRVRLPAPGGMR
jgi:muramoyltetrapeptide carboxypeptidase